MTPNQLPEMQRITPGNISDSFLESMLRVAEKIPPPNNPSGNVCRQLHAMAKEILRLRTEVKLWRDAAGNKN